jgi:hypothetical protein
MTPNRTQAGEESAPRMYTRGDAMRILRIGETSLHWLTRTGKLQTVRIGGRVLIPATEIARLCRTGASLTEAEKTAAREQITHHRGRSRGVARKQGRDWCGGHEHR